MPEKLNNVDIKLREAIGKRMTQLRKKTGKSQKDFAYETGRDKQSYNKNEKGKAASIYMVNNFCNDLGISLKDFFDSPIFKDSKK